MLGIHFSLTVLVAFEAGELLPVSRICVAFETLLPTALMRAAEDGEKEIVMIDKIHLCCHQGDRTSRLCFRRHSLIYPGALHPFLTGDVRDRSST